MKAKLNLRFSLIVRPHLVTCGYLLLFLGGIFAWRASAETPKRLAFLSCIDARFPASLWKPLLDYKPNVVILMGDNVYADTNELSEFRSAYAALSSIREYKAMRRKAEILATWDDHDYGQDDAGSSFAAKSVAKQAFMEFVGAKTNDPRRGRGGVYGAKLYGKAPQRLQIILLDTRWFRSELRSVSLPKTQLRRLGGKGPYVPNTDKQSTILGQEQWQWLEEQISIPAELRIIVSSIQVLAEFTGWESWANFPHERERLLSLLSDKPVLILSGDTHRAEVSRLERPNQPPLYEITSSSFNRPGTLIAPNRHRIGKAHLVENFGALKLSWTDAAPSVSVELRGEQASPLASLEIRFSADKGTQSKPHVERVR